MDEFEEGYRAAIADMKEKIGNANHNFYSADGIAPWSWNYEIEDMVEGLPDERF